METSDSLHAGTASTVEGKIQLPSVLSTSSPRRGVGGKHVLWQLVGLILPEKFWYTDDAEHDTM